MGGRGMKSLFCFVIGWRGAGDVRMDEGMQV